MLNYLTGSYFATSFSLFPPFCVLLFPTNAEITLGCLTIFFRQIYAFKMFRVSNFEIIAGLLNQPIILVRPHEHLN